MKTTSTVIAVAAIAVGALLTNGPVRAEPDEPAETGGIREALNGDRLGPSPAMRKMLDKPPAGIDASAFEGAEPPTMGLRLGQSAARPGRTWRTVQVDLLLRLPEIPAGHTMPDLIGGGLGVDAEGKRFLVTLPGGGGGAGARGGVPAKPKQKADRPAATLREPGRVPLTTYTRMFVERPKDAADFPLEDELNLVVPSAGPAVVRLMQTREKTIPAERFWTGAPGEDWSADMVERPLPPDAERCLLELHFEVDPKAKGQLRIIRDRLSCE